MPLEAETNVARFYVGFRFAMNSEKTGPDDLPFERSLAAADDDPVLCGQLAGEVRPPVTIWNNKGLHGA